MPIIRLIRYRFFLFAGLCPYILGQTLAFNYKGRLNWPYFFLGFLGIFFVLAGVELFNEYFDFKSGGDRIFSKEIPNIPHWFFPLGLLTFILAFIIGLYFTFHIGAGVLLFSFLGFLAAYFYVGPPLRWAYRGLGEIVIALSYGPFMMLGSYYIQAGKITLGPFLVSLIAGLAIFSLAILNEVPDFYQDRLVGKRNLVVRFGKEAAIRLAAFSWGLLFLFLAMAVGFGKIPYPSLLIFLLCPFLLKSLRLARGNMDRPEGFVPAIRISIVSYLMLMVCLSIGYLV